MISFINGTRQINIKQDIAITKQVATFFEFKIKGDYSINFQIPNDSANREALGIYNVSQTDNLRQDWYMFSDSNKIAAGELVVQKISPEFIELFFIAGNANWIKRLIDNTTDLNLLRYKRAWNQAAITERGRDYGIVYPLADWAYQFNKTTTTFSSIRIVDSSDNIFVDFYPCFYLKDLVREIIQQSGFKLTGNILQDTRYQKLIITPASADIKRNEKFVKERTLLAYKDATQSVASVDTYEKVTFNDVLANTRLWNNNTYTGDTNYKTTFDYFFSVSVDQDYTVGFYIDGVLSATQTFSGVEGVATFADESINGRDFEVYIKCNSGGSAFNININSSVNIYPDEVVLPATIGNEYVYPNDFIQLPCLDVIKFVVSYFGCYVYFDEYSQTISINRIDKIINQTDWSEYIKGYEAIYDARQATNNYLRLSESVDPNIIAYNSGSAVPFGDGNFTTDTDLNVSNELYEAPFAASESRVTIKYGNIMLPYIGLIQLEDLDEALEYTSVTDDTGRAQFNGDGFNLAGSEVVRVVDNSGSYSGYLVVNSTTYNYFQAAGMGFKGDSTGIFYKQRATFTSGKNRILLYVPDISVSSIGGGDSGGAGIQRHALELDVTEAVSGSPVYNAQFDNSLYSKTLTTTGTAIDLGQLQFLDNVTVFVSRVGNADDVVQVDYYRNGVLESSESPITAGNPVNVNYTYLSTVASDDFKVVITEG